MIIKVRQTIENNDMLRRGDTVIAGISGGADSVCLLSTLLEIKKEFGLNIVAVHVNHGIRGEEALRDESFVKNLCESLKVPCIIYRENVPEYAKTNSLTEEEAGRVLRYRNFYAECKKHGAKVIAVAHNQDDRAETILFNLIRGSSLTGLNGIKPVTKSEEMTGVSLIRPLLDCSRAEIEDYLKEKNQKWCEDSTNKDTVYTRNYIRRELIPAMERLSPKVKAQLVGLGDEAGEADDYIRACADRVYEKACFKNELILSLCMEQPPIIKKEVVYRFICENTGKKKDISRVHVSNVLKLFENEVGKSVDLPYDISVRRGYDRLIAVKRNEEQSVISFEPIEVFTDRDGEYALGDGKFLRLSRFDYSSNCEIPKEKHRVWFDADKIGQKLVLRTALEGDYFCPYSDGRTKKLGRLFIEEKIGRSERLSIPVIAEGNRCIWIPGIRRDEALRLDKNSKKALQMEIIER